MFDFGPPAPGIIANIANLSYQGDMSKTLDRAFETARRQPLETQEALARVIQSAVAGENLTPAEIERRHRNEHTRAALAEVERGEYMSLEDWERHRAVFKAKCDGVGIG